MKINDYYANAIYEIASVCHDVAESKGWHENEELFSELCCNITAEISEAWEEWRKGNTVNDIYFSKDKNGNEKPEGIPIELADAIIWILDACAEWNIDIGAAIMQKLEYNKTRSYRHGGKKV